MDEIVLQGLGASKGVYAGVVRVIPGPEYLDQLEKGEVLVCEHTDPNWITAFVTAGAVLTAQGSRLSHAAIVSRELKLPCVVALTQALYKLETGMVVSVDGEAGTVRVVGKRSQIEPNEDHGLDPEEEHDSSGYEDQLEPDEEE